MLRRDYAELLGAKKEEFFHLTYRKSKDGGFAGCPDNPVLRELRSRKTKYRWSESNFRSLKRPKPLCLIASSMAF